MPGARPPTCESIRHGLDWPIRTTNGVASHFHDRTRHVALRRPGDLLVLAIEREGVVIGDVSLHLRTTADETRTAEIGWLQLTAERAYRETDSMHSCFPSRTD
ncbi:hypothetical protein ACF1AJ_11090 [Leifsonia sp. NPDC014704]|uniref:hypothetical protein n=1 Tax=Leifsonia sp. NPDC014704 TaxID=3364123 RepID=UPI0036F48F1A